MRLEQQGHSVGRIIVPGPGALEPAAFLARYLMLSPLLWNHMRAAVVEM